MSEVTRAQWVNGSSLGWMLRQVASTCNNQVKERRFKESALSHSEEVTGMNHIHFGGIDRQEIYHAARPFFYRGDKYRHLRARTLRSGGKCFFLVPFYIHSTEDKTNSPTTIKSLFIWATLWVFPRTENKPNEAKTSRFRPSFSFHSSVQKGESGKLLVYHSSHEGDRAACALRDTSWLLQIRSLVRSTAETVL